MQFPHFIQSTHLSCAEVDKLLLLHHAYRIGQASGFADKLPCTRSLIAPQPEITLSHFLLSLFNTQTPIWCVADNELLFAMLEALNDCSAEQYPLDAEQILLLTVWFELLLLNSWVFPDDPDWLLFTKPQLTCPAMVERVEAFLTRVNQTLFPVDSEVFHLDPDALLWLVHYVPVTPLGYSIETENLQYYAEPARTVLSLIAHEKEVLHEAWLDEEEALLSMPKIPVSDLAATIREMVELPLVIRFGLPLLIESIEGTTGNLWLDVSYEALLEGYFGFEPWSPDVIAIYQEEWSIGKSLFEQLNALQTWVAEDEEAHMQQIQQLLIAARILKDKPDGQTCCARNLPRRRLHYQTRGRRDS